MWMPGESDSAFSQSHLRVVKKTLLFIPVLAFPVLLQAADTRIDIGRFSHNDLAGWEAKSFKGETRYSLSDDKGMRVLRADSHAAASGMFREIKVDLTQTPILNWSWKTGQVFKGIDEQGKEGDDYPVRVYVIFSGGLFFWKTRAINYVWSSNQPVGSTWGNAYTDSARMIAVESGREKVGQWVGEKRNILADFRTQFGEGVEFADAVAVMTDTDNSGQKATGWYGDIWFSAE
jgi:hypothetical protein